MRLVKDAMMILSTMAIFALACEGVDEDDEISKRRAAVPLTFKILNATDHPRFVELDGWTEAPQIAFQFLENDEWSRVHFDIEESACFPTCSDLENGANCINCSAPVPTVAKLEPGESLEFLWDGLEDVQRTVDSCFCYDPEGPRAGNYKMIVCSSFDVDRWDPEAEGDEGVITGSLTEERRCVEKTFEVPSSEEEIVIELASEEDENP